MEKNGTCTGVEASDAQGTHQFNARAVILADGGFRGIWNWFGGTSAAFRKSSSSADRPPAWVTACAWRKRWRQVTGLDYFYGHMLSRDAFTNDVVWPVPSTG